MSPRVLAVTRRTFAALAVRNYRLYFTGQIVSVTGTWMQSVAQAWLVLDLTGSGTALGLVVAMQFVPVLVGAPWGGVLADRVDKRRLLLVTQATAGLLALTLGLLTVTGTVELWMVFVLAALLGCVNAIDNPSRQTFVIEMVGPDHVANAVSLNSVVINAARVVGPAVAGVLIATLGIGICFLLNGASYLAVLASLLAIRPLELRRSSPQPRAPGQLREGFRYAWSTPELRVPLVMLGLVGMLAYEFTVTLPLLSEFTFGAGPGGFAAMTSLMGAGAVVGGLATAARGEPTPVRLAASAAVFGGLILAVALAPTLLVALLVLPLMGAASISLIALTNSTLQLRAAPQLRGRIMALYAVALLGSTPIGGPLVGYLGEHAGARVALAVGAASALLGAVYVWHQLVRPAAGRWDQSSCRNVDEAVSIRSSIITS